MEINIYKRIAALSLEQRKQLALRLGLQNDSAGRKKNPDKCLCAYIVARPDHALDARELRNYLSGILPGYMIPAHFVFLKKVPLTPHGKINMKALTSQLLKVGQEGDYTAPGDNVESLVAEVWKEVLNLEKVSVNDSFFELGGNSLKLLRLNNRLKEVFHQEIPVLKMFEYPTVKSLAAYISRSVEPAVASKANDNPGYSKVIPGAKANKRKQLSKRKPATPSRE